MGVDVDTTHCHTCQTSTCTVAQHYCAASEQDVFKVRSSTNIGYLSIVIIVCYVKAQTYRRLTLIDLQG